jgi:flavin reductase (DIM6/NTAB) family NADH-FMN oxidoreductase RutF
MTEKQIDFEKLDAARAYHFLTAMVVPRPIALGSTRNNKGELNAAPFSWFGSICADPPIISLSMARYKGAVKDSARNILEIKEFVINFCDTSLREKIDVCAENFPPEISEFDKAGLTALPSRKISVPGIRESKMRFECLLYEHRLFGEGTPVDLIFGKVLHLSVDANLFDENERIDVFKADPLARLNGPHYAALSKISP